MRRIDKITSKRAAQARQKEKSPSSFEKVVAEVEFALWKTNYQLPLTVEFPVMTDIRSELVRRLRRAYEDEGYSVCLDDSQYPSLFLTIQ